MSSVRSINMMNAFGGHSVISTAQRMQALQDEADYWRRIVTVITAVTGGNVIIDEACLLRNQSDIKLEVMHDKDNRCLRMRTVDQAGELVSWKGTST